MRALVIHPTASYHQVYNVELPDDPDARLTLLQALVGGHLEGLPMRSQRDAARGIVAYGNDEGKFVGLPRNRAAEELVLMDERDWFAGPVVISAIDQNGETVALPDDWQPFPKQVRRRP